MVGAAMCAAVALGYYPDFASAAEAFVQLGAQTEPLPENTETYENTYNRYTRTFKLLSENEAFRLE